MTFTAAVSVFSGESLTTPFQVQRVSDGAIVSLIGTMTFTSQAHSVYHISFVGSEIDPLSAQVSNPHNGSLRDGKYRLTIDGSRMRGQDANNVDAAGNGVPGSTHTSPTDTRGGGAGQLRLFRLFGDANGDGVVDQVDLGQFRSAFNAGTGNQSYLAFLDADNNGTIDQVDLGQFRSRFNANVW